VLDEATVEVLEETIAVVAVEDLSRNEVVTERIVTGSCAIVLVVDRTKAVVAA
jgi:hypothetical protein